MDEYRLWSMEYFVEKNKIWFIDFHTNDLFEQNLETGELLWMNRFPIEKSQFKSHPLCVKWKNDIFAFPDFGENIWIYHMETKEFSSISIGKRETKRYGSRNPIICGDDIWLPVCGQADVCEPRRILHVNAKSHRYEWSDSITKNGLCLETVYKDGYIYLASALNNILYAFNTEENKCESYCIEELEQGIETICASENELWLSDRTGKVACWDIALRKTARTTVLPFGLKFAGKREIKGPFLQSRYVKGKMCYIPAYTNPLQMWELVMVDPAGLSFQAMPIMDPEDVNDNFILAECVTDDGKIGVWSEKGNHIFLLDVEHGLVEEKKQVVSSKDRPLLWLLSHPVSTEDFQWNISHFLGVIKDDGFLIRKKDSLENCVGRTIYRSTHL